MKNFIKNISFLEPPFGEVMLVVLIIGILYVLGFVDAAYAVSWLVPALFLGAFFLCGFLLYRVLKRYF